MDSRQMIRIVVILICSTHFGLSQNLVPNRSFESHTVCPTVWNLQDIASWFLGPSTDALDTCNGYAPYIGGINQKDTTYPKHGHTFIGMHCFHYDNYREYAQVKLFDSLKAGECYYVEFYTKPDTYSPYLINNIAANFSTNSYVTMNYTTALQVPMHVTRFNNPIISDTTKWSLINGVYSAVGGEKYITLGNFNTCQNTNSVYIHPGSSFAQSSYYFFDSVSVIKINAGSPLPWSYANYTISVGDSVYVGNYLGGNASIKWYTMSGDSIGSGPGIYVKPDSTKNYEVRVTLCGITFRDTIKVTVKYPPPVTTGFSDVSQSTFDRSLRLFPSPAIDKLYVEWSGNAISNRPEFADVFDFTGVPKLQQKLYWSNFKTEINVDGLRSGVYLLRFSNNLGQKVTKRFTVYK